MSLVSIAYAFTSIELQPFDNQNPNRRLFMDDVAEQFVWWDDVLGIELFRIGGSGGASIGFHMVTYAGLTALIGANSLVKGDFYLITDFATKYTIPNTAVVNTGATEPIFMQASSNNTLNQNAISTLFPQDEISYEVVDSVGSGDKGRIYFRKDTARNNSTFYDWRTVQFRRWETFLGSGIFTVLTDNTFGFADFFTFNNSASATGCNNNVIGAVSSPNILGVTDGLNNTVFNCIATDNVFGDDCLQNTFTGGTVGILKGCFNNNIESIFIKNIIGDDFGFNTIDAFCYLNTIGSLFQLNVISYLFTQNAIGNDFSGNIVGAGWQNNTIGNTFEKNTIGDEFNFNIIANNFIDNVIGNRFQTNTTGAGGFLSNRLGDDFISNTVGDNFTANKVGNNFASNGLGTGFLGNQIGNSFGNNTFVDDFANNKIGNNFNHNTGGNLFQSNVIGNDAGTNAVGNSFIGNAIGNLFGANTIADSFTNNQIANDFSTNITLGAFGSNTISKAIATTTFGANFNSNNLFISITGITFPATLSNKILEQGNSTFEADINNLASATIALTDYQTLCGIINLTFTAGALTITNISGSTGVFPIEIRTVSGKIATFTSASAPVAVATQIVLPTTNFVATGDNFDYLKVVNRSGILFQTQAVNYFV